MREFYFDIETCSALNLTKVGSYLYARHPSTDIRCISFCLVTDGVRGPIETWMPGEPVPQAAFIVAEDPDARAVAFNNAFDRQIWEQILTPRYGWPAIPFERHRCAQAAALARALPASLDAAAAVLKITTRKTKEGVAAMKRLAGPRRQSAKERKAGAPLDFSATPEELATLAEYNRDRRADDDGDRRPHRLADAGGADAMAAGPADQRARSPSRHQPARDGALPGTRGHSARTAARSPN